MRPQLPEGHNVFAYVYQGDAQIGAAATAIERGELALTSHGASLPVTAGAEGARLIVVAAGRSTSRSRVTARS